MSGILRVLTSVRHDATLLPHFIAHYRALGVGEFAIVLPEEAGPAQTETERWAEELGPGIRLYPPGAWQKRTGWDGPNKDDLRRRVTRPEDWIIPADIDELIQFPLPVPELIARMEASGADYVKGRFSDRLSSDGSLVALDAGGDLWARFPLEAKVTARLVKGVCMKVVLCRATCRLSSGHHFVAGSARPLDVPNAVVHHFKWHAAVVAAMENRVETLRRLKMAWVVESERVLAYLAEHGRLVPEHFDARPGWRP